MPSLGMGGVTKGTNEIPSGIALHDNIYSILHADLVVIPLWNFEDAIGEDLEKKWSYKVIPPALKSISGARRRHSGSKEYQLQHPGIPVCPITQLWQLDAPRTYNKYLTFRFPLVKTPSPNLLP